MEASRKEEEGGGSEHIAELVRLLAPPQLNLRQATAKFEAGVIRLAEVRANGDRRRMAALLGIPLRTLFYKLARLGPP